MLDSVFAAIAEVFKLIVQPMYDLTGNWWIAILLFTLVSKIILIPMSMWVQKNSIVMVTIMPAINRIKIKYYGDRETIGEKQQAVYKEKGYHPLLSLIPLVIQIVILFGLVDVIHWITDTGQPGTEFLGLVPITDGGAAWIMPILAGLSAVIMGCAQNRINPLQKEQSRAEKNTTNGLSIGLSLVLGVFVAAGMCFYWICSNLSSILIQLLMNKLIKPAKYIDYEDLEQSRREVEELEALEANRKKKWYQRDPLAKREKADYKRFFNVVGKHIVFYSEGSGFYKYFKGSIEYLLAHSDVRIHYVTNDPDDQIFKIAESEPRILPYYIGQKRAITLMMKMDADVVVTTLEDLETYYIKRSYVRKDVEYVFAFHHMTSTHLTASETAYDHYDSMLCVGPHQVKEIRAAEKLRNLPAKNLVECGYGLIDENIAAYDARVARGEVKNERPTVLIGPSWQEDNILDSCFDDMVAELMGRGWQIIVRPHPEYVKRYRPRWEQIQARYAHVPETELYFERDFSSNESVLSSDVIITDWSSVFCEFCFSTLKPALFVDTTMKVTNQNWQALGIEPADIALRNKVGRSFDPHNLAGFGDAAADMIENAGAWRNRIEQVRSETIFDLGQGAENAGKFLLNLMLEKQDAVEEGGKND